MTDTGKCPAFGYDCEYVAKVEAQAAEIERLREACVNYDLALLLAFPNGASDEVFVHWNDARAALGATD